MRKKSHKIEDFIKSGRIQQKMKTRERLLAAATSMMITGEEISVESVAIQAAVSKATAYRYFSSKEMLEKEAALHNKSILKEDLFVGLAEEDLKGRIDKLVDYHYTILTNNEAEFRVFLSTVMKESVQNKDNYSRAGRRILLIEEALISQKKQIRKEEFDKKVSAISIILGIESISVLKDLCHLENDRILDLWKWMIEKIVF